MRTLKLTKFYRRTINSRREFSFRIIRSKLRRKKKGKETPKAKKNWK